MLFFQKRKEKFNSFSLFSSSLFTSISLFILHLLLQFGFFFSSYSSQSKKPHKDGISSFPNSSILHSVYQSSSSPPNPKPRSLLERRLRLIIISARPRKPLNFTPSCVSSDPNASDSIKRDECTSSHG